MRPCSPTGGSAGGDRRAAGRRDRHHEPRRSATARADELTDAEIRDGLPRLLETVRRHRPEIVAVLGVTAYWVAFDRPEAQIGPQPETLEAARLWVLPISAA